MDGEVDELLKELEDLRKPGSISSKTPAAGSLQLPPTGRSITASPVQAVKAAAVSRGCSPTPLVASASVDHLSVDELLRSLDIPSLSASQDGGASSSGARTLTDRPSFNTARSLKNRCRCNPVHLAGADTPHGWHGAAGAAAAAVGCAALRCTKCDCGVLRLSHAAWTDAVDYLFLRNRYPNEQQLLEGARRSPGTSAYCCQCSSTTAKGGASRLDVAVAEQQLRWVCAGHDPDQVA